MTISCGEYRYHCTMGNTASHEDDDPLDPFDGIDTLGYRVLGVQPNSPAAAAGLVSFLDFLVGVNGAMMLGSGQDLKPGEEYDDVDLPAVLEENKEKPVEFCTYSAAAYYGLSVSHLFHFLFKWSGTSRARVLDW